MDEYVTLPEYDRDTAEQPPAAFFCHQQNGRLCAGWVGTHDMDNSLGLRMVASIGVIDNEDYEAALNYESPVPLFESGAEAAAHGMAQIPDPDPKARRVIDRLTKKQERRVRE